MCVQPKSVNTSKCDNASEESTSSFARRNTIRSRYRVLCAAMGRPIPQSVDRDCAGRNAKPKGSSVKGSSSDKQPNFVVAERLLISEGTIRWRMPSGTTGVQDHGMYRRQLLELERSLEGRTRKLKFKGQEIILKSKITPSREVRWPHSSEEVR